LNIPIFERKMAGYLRKRIQHFLNTDIIPGLPILFQVAGSAAFPSIILSRRMPVQ
jgi:hypothetical protein